MFHEGALPVSSDERSNCCKPATCQCQSCNGDSPDPHFFSYMVSYNQKQLGMSAFT
ncbi:MULTISPECIES: hypothetical protein [Bacillus cereus group]|uniref:hypothetical protein n=1 Tax=Bacillus cereus group TaxID=86661 RepID=UPI0013E06494|nr:hypothetical protein [Bacillus thuringiensis]